MSALETLAVSAHNFFSQAEADEQRITVRLSGTADLTAREPLDTVLVKLHDEACRIGAKEVTIDLQKLEFMNSSCFKNFVSWIGRVQELEADRQYKIRFLSNTEMLWQRRSLHALQCFASHLISVET